MPQPGFWTAFGAPATVDWCEPNYLHSPYVAEWFNSLSSLLLCALGLAGIWHTRRIAGKLEPRFLLLFASLAAVGLGSAAFHATLLRSAQAFDELPMQYAILFAAYVLRFRKDSPPDRAAIERHAASERRWRVALSAYALTFTVVYFAFASYFAVFAVTYTVILIAITVGTHRAAFVERKSREFRRLCVAALAFNLLAGLGLWLPEHVLLPCDHPLQRMELHAWFHLFGGLGTYAWMLGAVVDRTERVGRRERAAGVVREVA
jgi:dihydroceramidase